MGPRGHIVRLSGSTETTWTTGDACDDDTATIQLIAAPATDLLLGVGGILIGK